MNLEKLRERQQGLNDLFQLHLNHLEACINKLHAEPEEMSKILEEAPTTNGIVSELFLAQESLERKIDKLNYLKQRLDTIINAPHIALE